MNRVLPQNSQLPRNDASGLVSHTNLSRTFRRIGRDSRCRFADSFGAIALLHRSCFSLPREINELCSGVLEENFAVFYR